MTVAERFAPYRAEMEAYRTTEMVSRGTGWQCDIPVDWKNLIDNYLEGYHVPTGHPGLQRMFGSSYTAEAQPSGVSRQIGMDGATWLDRELIANEPLALRKAGFGYEVDEALAKRQRWLIQQGLMQIEGDQVSYRTNLLSELRSRELARAGGLLSKELGLRYTETKSGQRIEGAYKGAVELASGKVLPQLLYTLCFMVIDETENIRILYLRLTHKVVF